MTMTFTTTLYDGDIEVGHETFRTFKEARLCGERHNLVACDGGDSGPDEGPSYNIMDANGNYW
jgi:hypothetical protein